MSTPRNRGFTLIELLIVVVIIGILASIAVPKFRETKGRAYAASLKADLRNLATSEEAYFYQHQAYTTDTLALNFTTRSGTRLLIVTANAGGWAATATHELAWPLTCALYSGMVAAPPPATAEGVVMCQ